MGFDIKNFLKKNLLLPEDLKKGYNKITGREGKGEERKSNGVIISIQGGHTSRAKASLTEKIDQAFKGNKTDYLKHLPMVTVKCSKKDVRRIIEESNNMNGSIRQNDLPEGVQLRAKPAKEVNLPPYRVEKVKNRLPAEEQWNIEMVGGDLESTSGEGMTIAVIDTGIDYRHQEISDNFGEDKGYNFVRDKEDPMDDNGHGTHVAGTVAGDNTGVAKNCQLKAYKVLNKRGSGSIIDIVRAIDRSIEEQVDVINMSLGSSYRNEAEEDACLHAYKKGIGVVASAGNNGKGYSYPATYEGVVSVAAVDKNKNHADFSNINDSLDISAPGVNIKSSYPGNKYSELSGTSMSSPHVAGALGVVKNHLMRQDIPGKMYDRMRETAEYLGEHIKFGEGLLRVDKMLKEPSVKGKK